ncbi:hypothetical protein L9W92_02310 [Pelotomaculum terephthalicicum JT]|uniref:hypothetical protein n=1 Tax=Pelotomaculum terephthalicicum TaxID=206393 RepID=UPI001F039450|nr:hypothetical protein [Pelotomaculum terephthalicicum]MCG9966892.1 hypothetical protein [Pelotomaculum terephthalicicum JT]
MSVPLTVAREVHGGRADGGRSCSTMEEKGGDCLHRHSEAPGAPDPHDWGRGLRVLGVEGPRRMTRTGP